MNQEPEITLGDLERSYHEGNFDSLFAQVVTKYYGRMVGFVWNEYGISKSEAAEDLVQKMFEELCENVKKGIRKKKVPVGKWLFKFLRKRCLDYMRKRKEVYLEDLNKQGEDSQGEDSSALSQIKAEWPPPADKFITMKQVTDCIEKLADSQFTTQEQEVFKLWWWKYVKPRLDEMNLPEQGSSNLSSENLLLEEEAEKKGMAKKIAKELGISPARVTQYLGTKKRKGTILVKIIEKCLKPHGVWPEG
jgi:RNA polymerase sigma factor (sigma-70 family)